MHTATGHHPPEIKLCLFKTASPCADLYKHLFNPTMYLETKRDITTKGKQKESLKKSLHMVDIDSS